jgi:hypothetical protein
MGSKPEYCCLKCARYADCCVKPQDHFCTGLGVCDLMCGRCRPLSCFKPKPKPSFVSPWVQGELFSVR